MNIIEIKGILVELDANGSAEDTFMEFEKKIGSKKMISIKTKQEIELMRKSGEITYGVLSSLKRLY
ncbi:MAG: hypothetical protein L6V81_06600 [Clostridium sp.]|nr:MAG: hypothetical protein L6V81_06600 [Clostridium sp.]